MSEGAAERTDDRTGFYRHAARPDWGVAVLLWEAEAKRGYQFADGNLRIFKQGYFHLMRAAEANSEQRAALAAHVRREASSSAPVAVSRSGRSYEITLSDQIEYFRSQFPQGFAGEPWQRKHRRGAKRSLQRHRDPTIELAGEQLAREKIDGWLAEGRPEAVVAALVEVLASTNLVVAAQRKQLEGLAAWQVERLARALRDLLWSEETLRRRLGGWITALAVATSSPTTTWALATAPLALVFPTEHVCVRQSSFRAQGARMIPPHDPGRTAGVRRYEGALAVARRVRDRLHEAGLQPADLLDVHDFMWLTLRPKARAAIAERRSVAASDRTAAPNQAGEEETESERAAA